MERGLWTNGYLERAGRYDRLVADYMGRGIQYEHSERKDWVLDPTTLERVQRDPRSLLIQHAFFTPLGYGRRLRRSLGLDETDSG